MTLGAAYEDCRPGRACALGEKSGLLGCRLAWMVIEGRVRRGGNLEWRATLQVARVLEHDPLPAESRPALDPPPQSCVRDSTTSTMHVSTPPWSVAYD